jgi:hypothetical protein
MFRKFSKEGCSSTGPGGQGCFCCPLKDPLWEFIDGKYKTDQKGVRKDLNKRLFWLLPIWNYTTNRIEVMEQGSEAFGAMDKFDDQGGDITSVDWKFWQIKMPRTTFLSDKVDSTQSANFQFTPEIQATAEAMLKVSIENLKPSVNLEALMKKLEAKIDTQAQLPAGQVQPQPGQLPPPPPQYPAQPQLMGPPITGTVATVTQPPAQSFVNNPAIQVPQQQSASWAQPAPIQPAPTTPNPNFK